MNIFQELSKFDFVKYFDKNHTYEIDGKPARGTSRFLGEFKKPFDSERIAEKESLKTGETIEAVLARWKFKADRACHKGHLFHSFAENLDANKIFPYEDSIGYDKEKLLKELKILEELYRRFREDTKDILIPVVSELVVGSREFNLCGTIDKIFYNTRKGVYQVFDWKTNEKFTTENRFSRFLDPISHLDESKLNTYSLQLSAYRLILERTTEIPFGDSVAVWFDSSKAIYKPIKMKDLRTDILKMLEKKP